MIVKVHSRSALVWMGRVLIHNIIHRLPLYRYIKLRGSCRSKLWHVSENMWQHEYWITWICQWIMIKPYCRYYWSKYLVIKCVFICSSRHLASSIYYSSCSYNCYTMTLNVLFAALAHLRQIRYPVYSSLFGRYLLDASNFASVCGLTNEERWVPCSRGASSS